MAGDDEDLIGSLPISPVRDRPSTGRRVGRPTNEEVAARLQERVDASRGKSIDNLGDMQEFYRPVSITKLADIFRMEPRTVKKRLANCPVAGHGKQNAPEYDFVQAADFLTKPKVDPASLMQWLKSCRVQDLPAHLAPGIQQALLSRQTYEQRAGQLWRTEDVQTVFGDVFLIFKDRTKLWVETLDESTLLTDEQREKLQELVDDLLNDIHEKLITMPGRTQTYNSLAHEQQHDVLAGLPEGDLDDDSDLL